MGLVRGWGSFSLLVLVLVLVLCACAHTAPRVHLQVAPKSGCAAPVVIDATTVVADSPEDTLAREVSAIRGLPLLHGLHVLRLAQGEFLMRTHGGPADEATTATYVAFGFMHHDPNAPAPVLRHAAYLGVFDFATHELLIRNDLTETITRGALVHEIGHALQDQTFGMPRHAEGDDAALAIKSLYEGDATLTRDLYAAISIEQRAEDRVSDAIMIVRTNTRESVAKALGVPDDATREPRFGETISTYLDGMVFVASLWQKGGFDLVNSAYTRVPVSTEQILHPDKYLANELPIVVAAPNTPAGTTKLAEGTLGELRTRLLLARCSKTPPVGGWGWGGDRFVVGLGTEGRLALTWSTVWDTEGDATRFESALRWVSARCWSSERRDGWWIGQRTTITRRGVRVEYTRS